jgi:hypothetical protein
MTDTPHRERPVTIVLTIPPRAGKIQAFRRALAAGPAVALERGMTKPSMKVRLIQSVEGQFLKSEFPLETAILAMQVRGYEYIGPATRPSLRAELQGAPRFKGVNGPMWDGDAIRYECPEAYKELSR